MPTPSISDESQPRLARGVRFQIDSTSGKGVLLFPEGILELNETAQEIVTRRSDPYTIVHDWLERNAN